MSQGRVDCKLGEGQRHIRRAEAHRAEVDRTRKFHNNVSTIGKCRCRTGAVILENVGVPTELQPADFTVNSASDREVNRIAERCRSGQRGQVRLSGSEGLSGSTIIFQLERVTCTEVGDGRVDFILLN